MPLQFKNIHVNSAPQALAQQIVDRINSGELKPGSQLPSQRKLSEMFGVGLSSIREAVKILDVMGCIFVIHGRGMFVTEDAPCTGAQLTDTARVFEAVSLRDLLAARQVVECAAAAMAAGQADEESIAHLKSLIQKMRKNRDSTRTYYRLDFAFHLAVAEATGNRAIIEITRLLVERSHDYIGFMDESLGISMALNAGRAVDTAEQTVTHIAAGQKDEAGRAMHDHLNIVNIEIDRGFFKKPD